MGTDIESDGDGGRGGTIGIVIKTDDQDHVITDGNKSPDRQMMNRRQRYDGNDGNDADDDDYNDDRST